MRILNVGASGTIGRAVTEALTQRGHEVLAAHRSSKKFPVDITDTASIDRLLRAVGRVDALVCTTGGAPFGPWGDMDREAWLTGVNDKLLGQVELVRRGCSIVREGGSFTLVTGVLSQEPIRGSSVASAINGALESWVLASAGELWGRHRINAVSPTVLAESQTKYATAFPGFPVVEGALVGAAYVRSVESMETGQVYRP